MEVGPCAACKAESTTVWDSIIHADEQGETLAKITALDCRKDGRMRITLDVPLDVAIAARLNRIGDMVSLKLVTT